MTPPWPATKLELGQGRSVGALKFSPCGSFLASGAYSSPYQVHVCDRRGRQTCLRGHTMSILFLSFSTDGKYLASAGHSYHDTSIRIWPTDSTTRLPRQSDKRLLLNGLITCLDFSPADSNILASGEAGAAIKLWNVEQEVCIYSFDHYCGSIQSLYFPVQDEGHTCIFVTSCGSLIQTHWGRNPGILTIPLLIRPETVRMPGLFALGGVGISALSNCGSLLAAATPDDNIVTLYNMRTMTVLRKLTIPRNMSLGSYGGLLAFSPDGKTLVLRLKCVIQIYEVPDLNIKRLLQPDASGCTGAVAFDPSGQFLASAVGDENVRLWTL
jgi:WD40 repeat protein